MVRHSKEILLKTKLDLILTTGCTKATVVDNILQHNVDWKYAFVQLKSNHTKGTLFKSPRYMTLKSNPLPPPPCLQQINTNCECIFIPQVLKRVIKVSNSTNLTSFEIKLFVYGKSLLAFSPLCSLRILRNLTHTH